MAEENNSGTNTVLIVLVLIIVVAFVVWFFRGGFGAPAAPEDPGINVDVNLPTDEQGGNTGDQGGQQQ